jgi:hypothetical protein
MDCRGIYYFSAVDDFFGLFRGQSVFRIALAFIYSVWLFYGVGSLTINILMKRVLLSINT